MIPEPEKPSIFQLSVDENTSQHLSEIAKWGKFLGIIGFIGLGLILVAWLVVVSLMSWRLGGSSTFFLSFIYVIFVGLYVYPVLTLYKFGKGMKSAILNNDQILMNNALRNLKNCFQYLGILTIIILCIYGTALVIGLLAASFNF